MFFTYDTKIKQIGGIGDHICIPNVYGTFDSFDKCQATKNPIDATDRAVLGPTTFYLPDIQLIIQKLDQSKPNPTPSYVTQPQFRLWPPGDPGHKLIIDNFGRSLKDNAAKRSEVLKKPNGLQRIKRREILIETLRKFQAPSDGLYYHKIARDNLMKWAINPPFKSTRSCVVNVVELDWGVATQMYTKQYGKCFAVLNMANGTYQGGGYTSGASAQEENMFRRTDCHFSLNRGSKYTQQESNRINGVHGLVYLDTNKARVCIRGPENIKDTRNLGYTFLDHEEIFPFYELRAAAVDLSNKEQGMSVKIYETETRKRIAAQLDTLINAGIRHVVLSAFGCGAFENPPKFVANVYYEALNIRRGDFDIVVFAIFYAGNGLRNYDIFAKEFKKW